MSVPAFVCMSCADWWRRQYRLSSTIFREFLCVFACDAACVACVISMTDLYK